MLGGGSPPPLTDVTPKVLEIEPFLEQIARQVPALGPDVDRLNVELKSRMGGIPLALANMAGPAGGPPVTAPSDAINIQGAPNPGAPNPGTPGIGATPPAMPSPPTDDLGAMDTAMQIEMKLPAIGKDDPTLMPYITGFIARMREEVPKVVNGETEAMDPPPQQAPTESMLSRIPVTG
jgi:hypothetical protein